MENLQRHTVSGLRHICDLLGAPESEDDAHVAEMVSWVNVGMDSWERATDQEKPSSPMAPKMRNFGVPSLTSLRMQHACLSTKCVIKHLTFSDGCVSSWQVHQLEFILDSLVDEKDRSTQKRGEATSGRAAGVGAGHGSANSASDGSSQLSLEISVSRPAEIEAALQQFVSPKVAFYSATPAVFTARYLLVIGA